MTDPGHTNARAPRCIALLGVPLEAGAPARGAAMGPAALRTAGLREALVRLGHQVEDHGDSAPVPGAGDAAPEGPGQVRNAAEIAAWARAIDRRAGAIFAEGAIPVFLGGDHSFSMGSVNGIARACRHAGRELHVLWLDAHADFNTPATSPTGNAHGMPLAFLCGEEGFDWVLDRGDRLPLDPRRVTLLGIRSTDQEERRLLRDRGLGVIDMRLIDEFGVSHMMRRYLEMVSERGGIVHVSFDVDVLDPAVAPAVGTAVPGGITYREAHLILEMLADSGLVVSADVAELNPFLDDRGRTACVLVELIASLFGQTVFDHPIEPRWTV